MNSTRAAVLVAAKLHIPVDHVEAGLRSFDRALREEINRLVTDSISDQLFASEPSGFRNLLREGYQRKFVHLVGNVMIDSLVSGSSSCDPEMCFRPAWPVRSRFWCGDAAPPFQRGRRFFPTSCDGRTETHFRRSTASLSGSSENQRKDRGARRFRLASPGDGVQEETTFLGVPCLTLRNTTERPVTVEPGLNILVGDDPRLLHPLLVGILSTKAPRATRPRLWDGRSAERIARIINALV